MENDKNKQKPELNKSNDERDQDEGSMNNGTIGGEIGIDSNDINESKLDTNTENEPGTKRD